LTKNQNNVKNAKNGKKSRKNAKNMHFITKNGRKMRDFMKFE